ncbi:MAG: histidine phosphatase family protein [Rikenellaceae bacterium]
MAKIYLQRHTQPNISSDICYGASDIDLHPEFESLHLEEVLNRTKELSITQIYSSPLQRCHKLALRIKESTGVETVILDDRLKELNFGDWELTPWEDIYNTPGGREWFDDYINCRTPNGEAFTDLRARAESFLEYAKSLDGDILVVTHSGFMRAMKVATGAISEEEVFSLDISYGELMEL